LTSWWENQYMTVSAWPRATSVDAAPDAERASTTPSDPPARSPILVDTTGRRGRVVRLTTLVATVGAITVLLAAPVALVLPERVQRTGGAGAVAGVSGAVSLDTNCDGLADGSEPAVASVQVSLIRVGQGVVARTVTDPAGRFSFGEVAPGSDYEVSLANRSSSSDPSATVSPTVRPISPSAEYRSSLASFSYPDAARCGPGQAVVSAS
jgi:hypothetical protein